MTSRTEYCTQTPNKPSLFDVQYLRNHRTLDIGVLGYIGIVWPKEHFPEVRSFPPGTPVYLWSYLTQLLLRIKNISNRSYRGNQNTHFMSNCNPPPQKKLCPLGDKVKNIIRLDRPQMAIWQILVACCLTMATNTHSEYVILIGFPQQQQLHEHASMLRYMYIACLVVVCLNSSLLVGWKCIGMWTVMVEFWETSNCDCLP